MLVLSRRDGESVTVTDTRTNEKIVITVVGTLANMMAFGTMPESVFYGALTDAAAPTVRNHGAFLNAKVQRLKKEYRWCS